MRHTRRLLISALLIFHLSLAPAIAQQAAQAPAKPQTVAELQARIAALLDQPQFAASRFGVRVITGKGSVVFERDADKTFAPASNMKLYTTAATLDAFGPEQRFKTSVYATKRDIRNGVLRGDLILYGRGDPNLSARFENPDNPGVNGKIDEFVRTDKITAIEMLADQIKARGIRTVSGDLIGDDSYFATDGRGAAWEWDDLMFYYGAPVSALTVNDNALTFVVTPAARAGLPPVITTRPQTAYVKIVNHATTSASGQTRIGANRTLETNTFEFFGSIPAKAKEFEVDLSIHDPASFAATLLREALQRRGITVTGRVRHVDAVARLTDPFDESKLTELASLQSQPLSVLLKVINKPSQNLHTEIMLRQLGVRLSEQKAASAGKNNGAPGGAQTVSTAVELDDYGRPKSSESLGLEALRAFLQRAGIDTRPLSLRDGSGLARQDLVSPRSTSRLLEFMTTHPHFAIYRDSLPIAGVDGTLERRMRGTPAERNVRAKTGTLSYVNSLSGYATTRRGQMLIFSMMANNYTGPGRDVTAVFDQICALLTDFEETIPD
ncbi:MAG TPA: D-alanyl-D-alanine carboxypeptidase/D-alanyl-D-alanine-endopeptidase [Blastocatellia bacterium]|nr:D-alanyl-D-alanine carboxypeptidase/D-alanyl-D-alanine-endopeptidase [Blastocatellia bacterium]